MNKIKIAVFASGAGTNALNIIRHFNEHPLIEIAFVLSNKSTAGILPAAQQLGIPVLHYPNAECENGAFMCSLCTEKKIDFIILAGYLRLIPEALTEKFSNKIINIHPALLPAYGGPGMYGMNVHKAILANQEKLSGITIHFIDKEFDKGRIIAQFTCTIEDEKSAEEIQQKVQRLEHTYFPFVIEKTIVNYEYV